MNIRKSILKWIMKTWLCKPGSCLRTRAWLTGFYISLTAALTTSWLMRLKTRRRINGQLSARLPMSFLTGWVPRTKTVRYLPWVTVNSRFILFRGLIRRNLSVCAGILQKSWKVRAILTRSIWKFLFVQRLPSWIRWTVCLPMKKPKRAWLWRVRALFIRRLVSAKAEE